MCSIRRICVMFVVLLLLATPTLSTFAQSSPATSNTSSSQTSQQSTQAQAEYKGDVESYAKDFNVSLDEAVRRINIAEKLGDLQATLEANEPDNFAGLWIDNGAQYRVVIQLLHGPKKDVLKYVTDLQIADAVDVVHVPNSHKSLTDSQAQLQRISQEVSVPIGSAINVKDNMTEVYVEDQAAFETELGKRK